MFNVQSYPYLQPSSPDPTLALLQQMSLQLNSFLITPPFINSTHAASIVQGDQTPETDPWAVTLNVLWFSALISSLASAYLGIMVKQWLQEYRSGCSGAAQESARLRQYRLDNLVKWRVAGIVAILPLLLQLSLALFFGGLLILLWHLHSTVAIVASVLVGVMMSLVVGMTVLPTIWSGCSYLSPPTHFHLYAAQRIVFGIKFAILMPCSLVTWVLSLLDARGFLPADLKDRIPDLFRVGLRFHPWLEKPFTTWRGHERAAVLESSSKLDVDMIVTSYAATMDLDHVADTALVMLMDKDVSEVDRCFTEITSVTREHASKDPTDFAAALLQRISWIAEPVCDPAGGRIYRTQGWESRRRQLVEEFRHLQPVQQQTYLFMLSAAVVANGPNAHTAFECLYHLFKDQTAICQSMPWSVQRYGT